MSRETRHNHRKYQLTEQSIERADKDPWSVDMGTIQLMADHIRALEGAIESILWATEDSAESMFDTDLGDAPTRYTYFTSPGIPTWESIRDAAENLLITRREERAENGSSS